jgi:hypothetical protein
MVISDVYPVDQNNTTMSASLGKLKLNSDESALKKWKLAGFWSSAPSHHPAGLILFISLVGLGTAAEEMYCNLIFPV